MGLICSACHRPGYWYADKPIERGGDHLIRHSGRAFPCRVPRKDPEVKRMFVARNRRVESEAVPGDIPR